MEWSSLLPFVPHAFQPIKLYIYKRDNGCKGTVKLRSYHHSLVVELGCLSIWLHNPLPRQLILGWRILWRKSSALWSKTLSACSESGRTRGQHCWKTDQLGNRYLHSHFLRVETCSRMTCKLSTGQLVILLSFIARLFVTGMAMGMSLNELDSVKQLEVITFRRQILDVCVQAIEERGGLDKNHEKLALYKYPPNIESKTEPPEHIRSAINGCKCVISSPPYPPPTSHLPSLLHLPSLHHLPTQNTKPPHNNTTHNQPQPQTPNRHNHKHEKVSPFIRSRNGRSTAPQTAREPMGSPSVCHGYHGSHTCPAVGDGSSGGGGSCSRA